jgi:predicted nucleic acid-binding protein
MNVVDSSGWLEYFINGENDFFFAPVIENADDVLVPTISLFEVFKRVLIEKNRDDALEAIALMKEGRIVDLDDSLALVAAELSHELKLPMADSIILATARAYDAILWTQDAHFKGMEGVKYIEKKLMK